MYNPNRFLLIVLWFGLFIVSGASQAVDNIKSNSTVNPNFNLNNLYAKNKYSVMLDQWGYDAKAAQLACNDPKGERIWSEDPNDPFPDPRPNPADCGEIVPSGDVHAQMAYGCDVRKGLGPQIAASVVRIIIPTQTGRFLCSGTVVDRYWVVSAAHCFMDKYSATPGKFNSMLKIRPAIVQWIDGTEAKIGTIYIPRNYNGEIPEEMEVSYDLALLHLDSPLSARFIPIDLNQAPLIYEGENVWLAGYGDSKIEFENLFHFRRGFALGTKEAKYFINDTYPVKYKGVYSSWSFGASGDSGGPALIRDHNTGKLSLVGIYSFSLFCLYPGFFSDMSAAAKSFTSVAYHFDLMTSILHGTASPGDVRCISYNGGCERHIQYVINQSSNNISTYKGVNNILEPTIKTGNYPTQIATGRGLDGNSYAFVTNYMNNTLSRYKIGISGLLIDLHNNFQLNGKGPVDIALHNGYVYVVEHATPQIGVYQINGHGGGLIYKKSLFANVEPMSISIIGNYAYVPNYGYTIGKYISIYDLSALDGGKFSYNYRLDDIDGGIDGNLLQVIGGIDPDQLYLLTTKGVYLFNIQMVNGLPRLVLMANTSKDLISVDDARIQPITSDLVAVSSGKLGNKLFVFQKAGNQLFKVQELDTPGPTGMSFLSISNISGVLRRLYVTNFYSRMMTEYTLNPANNKLEKSKEVPTVGEPSRIIYRNWSIPAE